MLIYYNIMSDKITLLFEYLKNNKDIEFIKLLNTNDNLDVNMRDDGNNYLLFYAISMNKYDIVKLLINKGARLDIIDHDNRPLLYNVIKLRYNNILALLLDYNDNNIGISLADTLDTTKNTPLYYAIRFNNMEAFDMLLPISNLNIKNSANDTPLYYAVYTDIKYVKKLCDAGANVNLTNGNNETNLNIACWLQKNDIAIYLLENGADPNIETSNLDQFPINVVSGNNNVILLKALLKYGANPNTQNFDGLTPLHYSVYENSLDTYNILIRIDNINCNFYNFEGNTPLHFVYKFNHDISNYTKLLQKSNINYQNNENVSVLYYMTIKNDWKKLKDILKKKKLNIFLKDRHNKRVIDNISKDDYDEFIDMVADSYNYILKTKNRKWTYDWENRCKTELFADQLNHDEYNKLKRYISNNEHSDDMCKYMIIDKLNTIYKSNKYQPSYPIKLNKKQIQLGNLGEFDNIEYSTFLGNTLDVISGLLYIIKNNKNVCIPMSQEDIKHNKDLCSFNMQVYGQLDCSQYILNAFIHWIEFKLYLTTDFENDFKKCSNSHKRFTLIYIRLLTAKFGHANFLIYDNKTNEIERYEPHGHKVLGSDLKQDLLDTKLEAVFKKIDPTIKYISSTKYQQKIGLQILEGCSKKVKHIGDPLGFCVSWAIWYAEMRIRNPDINRNKLIKKIISEIKTNNIEYRHMIRNYTKRITDIRDDILHKVDLNINKWQNENYTQQDFNNVLEQVTIEIKKYK